MEAAQSCPLDIDVVEKLLAIPAVRDDIHSLNSLGESALFFCVRSGTREAVLKLLAAGSDVHSIGFLHPVHTCPSVNIARCIIKDHGYDPTRYIDSNGRTPLDLMKSAGGEWAELAREAELLLAARRSP